MSEDHFAKTTRRDFLSTATIATAALTVPVASEAQEASTSSSAERIKVVQANTESNTELTARSKAGDWTKPAAMAIPKDGYFKPEQGRYGPIFRKTPANYGFTIIAKIKPGREEAIRAYGKTKRTRLRAVRLCSPRSSFATCDGSYSTSAAIRILCTKAYSILILINIPKMRSLSSNRRGSTPSSKILRASRWIGRPMPQLSLNSSASINVQVF
jgi:Ubiquitinol-cytochrome C reductase Fe-S subunit TAT signal